MKTIKRTVAIVACPKEINHRANDAIDKDTYLMRLGDWGKFRQYLERNLNQLQVITAGEKKTTAEAFFTPIALETLEPLGFVLRARVVADIPVEMENDNFVLTFFPGDRNFYGMPGDARNYMETQTSGFITRVPYGEETTVEHTSTTEAANAAVSSMEEQRTTYSEQVEIPEEPVVMSHGNASVGVAVGKLDTIESEKPTTGTFTNQNKFEYVDIVHLVELEFVGGEQELLVCYADQSWEAVTIEWPNPFGPWQVVAKAVLGNEHLPAASKLSTLLTTANAALSIAD